MRLRQRGVGRARLSLSSRAQASAAPPRALAVTRNQPYGVRRQRCFGGNDFGTLYITSASQNLSVSALEEQPLAGSVFAAYPGVKGLPEARFAGPVLRGWSLSGTVTLQDGTPVDPFYFAIDFANSGTPNEARTLFSISRANSGCSFR